MVFFNLKKLLSSLATETGRINNKILRATTVFGNKLIKFFGTNNLNLKDPKVS